MDKQRLWLHCDYVIVTSMDEVVDSNYAILIVTLPTQPSAVRLRVWRALKSLGCVALRDGAYVLPIAHVAELESLAAQVLAHGGRASVLQLSPRVQMQQLELLAQFDRSEAYVEWQASARQLQAAFDGLNETEARRKLRSSSDALQAIARIDYFPGEAALQAQDALVQLRQALETRFSRGEPQPMAGDVPLVPLKQFQRRRWATRARPWVDRLASAWLIRRFIDTQAQFVWLADAGKAPRGVIGFDFDGARFTHVGHRVTFEVLMASFALEQDPRLLPIAATVHYLDADGIATPQAAGLEAVLAGLRELHPDDDALLSAACAVFDALYAMPAGKGASIP